jgi:DNA-binding transcriptional ArsR family regulator
LRTPRGWQFCKSFQKVRKCVTDLEDLLPARQANLSQHLALLRHTQLVDFAQDAQTRCYYLAKPKLTRILLEELARNETPVSKSTEQIKAEKAKLEAKQAAIPKKAKPSASVRASASMSQRIYLDYNATTPLSKLVKAELVRLLELDLGNPSSRHWAGTPAAEIVELSRIRIASLIGCDPTEIIFTSGGTEANNHAIKGVFFANRHRLKQPHFIISSDRAPRGHRTAAFSRNPGGSRHSSAC